MTIMGTNAVFFTIYFVSLFILGFYFELKSTVILLNLGGFLS